MECNRDEALRAKGIAERKVSEKDYIGAKKFALKAQNLFPSLEGVSQMIATLDVYLASEARINGEKDLYAILHISYSADEEAVKKQYRKLALLLHPDKNKFAGAEGAFQLVSEAWNVLSDKIKKMVYDQKISAKGFQLRTSQASKTAPSSKNSSNGFSQPANSATTKARHQQSNPQRPPTTTSAPAAAYMHPLTFWTSCARCCMQYEYHRMYLNKSLRCPKCKHSFIAAEVSAPPNAFNLPKWKSKHHNLNDKNINDNKIASSCTRTGSSRFEHGGNANSSSGTKFHCSSFPGVAATADADKSSATVAQANEVKEAYEKAKRQEEETHTKIRREEALRKRVNASRMNTIASANLNIGTGADINVSRRTNFGGHAGNNSVGNQKDINVGKTTNTFSQGGKFVGVSGDSKSRLCSKQTTFNKDFLQVDVRPLLIEKAKVRISKEIENLKSADAAKDRVKKKQKQKQKPEEDMKDFKKFDENHFKDTVKVQSVANDTLDESLSNMKVLEKAVVRDDSNFDLDKKINPPLSIDVPDADFHDFDADRTEDAFDCDQIWATYDDDDGMPRYYSLIQKVLSTNPFKVRMSFLTSKSNAEFTQLDWVSSGFTKTCGEFRVGRYEVVDTINIFSHRVKWDKGLRGVIKVLPKKGDTWALYRNWTPHWDENTSDDVIHKYDMVEVLGDYIEDQGVSVISLVKVVGFKTVFHRDLNPKEVKKIPKQEMFRFSHQVPCYLLTGDEADNAPKGCLELDPASTPLELLQTCVEENIEVEAIEVEQLTVSQ